VEPVILTRGQEVLTLTTLAQGGAVVRWPPMSAHNAVYVLMARPANAKAWTQISQVQKTLVLKLQMEKLHEKTFFVELEIRKFKSNCSIHNLKKIVHTPLNFFFELLLFYTFKMNLFFLISCRLGSFWKRTKIPN